MRRSEFLFRAVATTGWLATGAFLPALARAETYPTRPVRVIVPTTPGGPSDVVARAWSQDVGQLWNASFVIDNKPGGSQVIGTQAVAGAPADGYTLLQAASSMSTMPLVVENLPFDVTKDFVPVSFTHLTPLVVVIAPRLPVRSMAELVKYVKDNPGKLSFGHTGEGSSQQLATRLLAQKAGLRKLAEIPYKGSTQAHPDLISGRLSVMIDPLAAVAPHIRSGAVRALGVTTATRFAGLPDLPTVSESGVPGYEVSSWGGVFAPARTPGPVIDCINAALRTVLDKPDNAKRFTSWGLIAKSSTPAEFDAFVKSEVARWRAVMLAPQT